VQCFTDLQQHILQSISSHLSMPLKPSLHFYAQFDSINYLNWDAVAFVVDKVLYLYFIHTTSDYYCRNYPKQSWKKTKHAFQRISILFACKHVNKNGLIVANDCVNDYMIIRWKCVLVVIITASRNYCTIMGVGSRSITANGHPALQQMVILIHVITWSVSFASLH